MMFRSSGCRRLVDDLFRDERLCRPGNPSIQAVLVQSLSHCAVMNFNLSQDS